MPLQQLIKLEDIASEHDIVLFDTSSIRNTGSLTYLGYRDCNNHGYKRINILQEVIECFKDLKSQILRIPHILVTEGVFNEFYTENIISENKNLKNADGRAYAKKIKEVRVIRRRLGCILLNENRILQLDSNQNEIYDLLFEDYRPFKTAYELSDVDYNFLMSGLALAYSNKSTALISNDNDILDSYEGIFSVSFEQIMSDLSEVFSLYRRIKRNSYIQKKFTRISLAS